MEIFAAAAHGIQSQVSHLAWPEQPLSRWLYQQIWTKTRLQQNHGGKKLQEHAPTAKRYLEIRITLCIFFITDIGHSLIPCLDSRHIWLAMIVSQGSVLLFSRLPTFIVSYSSTLSKVYQTRFREHMHWRHKETSKVSSGWWIQQKCFSSSIDTFWTTIIIGILWSTTI